MKSIAIIFLLVILAFTTNAQKQVELHDISKYVGDSVIVKGKVFSSRAVSGGKLLLINLGGAFPNQLLTVVLQENVQKVLAEPLKSDLQEISIAGKVELYRDKPQIVVKDPAQIQSIITEKPAVKN
jgi:DNA/RNA endonuclease YhcR with UshA esterase domain